MLLALVYGLDGGSVATKSFLPLGLGCKATFHQIVKGLM